MGEGLGLLVSTFCPRWQFEQTPMKRERELHAGPHRNNRLIKARLSIQSSLQVPGSQLDGGMSRKGGGFLFQIKFRSRQLTQPGFSCGLTNGSNGFHCRFYLLWLQYTLIHIHFCGTCVTQWMQHGTITFKYHYIKSQYYKLFNKKAHIIVFFHMIQSLLYYIDTKCLCAFQICHMQIVKLSK